MSPTLANLYYGRPDAFLKPVVATAGDSRGDFLEVKRADPFTGTPVSINGRYGANKVNLSKTQGKTIGEAILRESGNSDRLKPEYEFNVEVRKDGIYVDGLACNSYTTTPGYWESEAGYHAMRANGAARTAARYRAIADAVKKADTAKEDARAEVCAELGFTPYNTLTNSTRKAVDRIVELKKK